MAGVWPGGRPYEYRRRTRHHTQRARARGDVLEQKREHAVTRRALGLRRGDGDGGGAARRSGAGIHRHW